MKKNKKIKVRKRKVVKQSGKSASSPKRRTFMLLVSALILCIVIAGLYLAWLQTKTRKEPKKTEVPTSSIEQVSQKPDLSTLSTEQQFTVLKEEEMELAQHVLQDFPNNDDSYVLMGDLHSRHGNSTEAMKFWEKGLEINPKRFDVYRNMGQLALQMEDFDKAVEFGRKALEIQPYSPGVHSNIAQALMDCGKYSEAVTELEEELKLSPTSITAHFQLAEVYLQLKEYDKAKKYYEETIKLEPNHSHAYHGLMTVHVRLKQPDKAKEYEVTFKKLRVKQSRAYRGRQWNTLSDLASLRESVVRTYLDSEQLYLNGGDIAKAEELLIRAYKLEPDNSRSLERLAFLYYKTNRPDKALEYFEKASQVDPNNPYFHLNVGQVADRLKMFDKAEQAFQKSIKLAPSNAAGYRELARLYLYNKTNLPQARNFAKKALSLEKTAANYFLFGWASDVNGDRTGALGAMEQAIKLEPQNRQYRKIYEEIKARN